MLIYLNTYINSEELCLWAFLISIDEDMQNIIPNLVGTVGEITEFTSVHLINPILFMFEIEFFNDECLNQ